VGGKRPLRSFRCKKQPSLHSYVPGITLLVEYSAVYGMHPTLSNEHFTPHTLSHTTFPSPYSRPSKMGSFVRRFLVFPLIQQSGGGKTIMWAVTKPHQTLHQPKKKKKIWGLFCCSGQKSPRSCDGAVPNRLLSRRFRVWVKT
jgi:hypothetical protein